MGSKSRFQAGAHEFVSQFVREAIRAGRWGAGEAIDVTALAAELHVSPSPVREALARLRGEGILGTRHRDGYSLPLLQAHELADEYRFVGLISGELARRVQANGAPGTKATSYAARMEAFLISLAQTADLAPAALRLHQSALRLRSYMSAEADMLPKAEPDLVMMELLLDAGLAQDLAELTQRHFAECAASAPAIARFVFEHSTKFEKAFD